MGWLGRSFSLALCCVVLCVSCRTDRFWFVMISNALTGITHVQITLSHFAMPTVDAHENGYDLSRPNHFIESQFRGSMNVDCSPQWDWFHGGLQFQIEHHLFPRIPRHHLRHVMEQYIRPFAARHSLPYQSASFIESNRMVFASLRAAAYKARETPIEPITAANSTAAAGIAGRGRDGGSGGGAGGGGAGSAGSAVVAAGSSMLYQFINAEG